MVEWPTYNQLFENCLPCTLDIASSIIVFGLVPSGSSPARASYAIDNIPVVSPRLAATTECISNVQIFNSSTLVDVGQLHNINISVTQASIDEPYILDHLWLCKAGTRVVQSPNGTTGPDGNEDPPTGASSRGLSAKDAAIISLASVLGLVVILALAVYIYVRFWVPRRRQRVEAPLDSSRSSETLCELGRLSYRILRRTSETERYFLRHLRSRT